MTSRKVRVLARQLTPLSLRPDQLAKVSGGGRAVASTSTSADGRADDTTTDESLGGGSMDWGW